MAIQNSPAQITFSQIILMQARFKANASSQEQKFIENLVVESIEIYGQDIYYVPRTIVNRDSVFEEDSDGKFESAKAIRAYVNNVEGWEGQGETLSKFGIVKTRQLLYSPVRNLKSMWTTVQHLMSKGDQTKGLNLVPNNQTFI